MDKKKILIALALILVALLSMSKISDWATNPKTHEHSISELDDQITTVLELTAGATAASAAISFLPDDQCTPIAQEIAELAKYFLVVLSALYLEKYLITVTGLVAFKIMIPVACLLVGIGLFAQKEAFTILSGKVAIGALIVYLMVPSSVMVSDMVYANYASSIDDTIETAKDISYEEEIEDEAGGIWANLTSWVSESVGKARDYVSNLFTHFVEALAVMIVTSCVIPILVLFVFMFLIKLVFGVDMSDKVPRIFKTKIR